jgi:hypothetical protein
MAAIIHNKTADSTRRIKTIDTGSKVSKAIEVNIKEVPQKNMAITRMI